MLCNPPPIDDPRQDAFRIHPGDVEPKLREHGKPANSVFAQGAFLRVTGDTSQYVPPPPGQRPPITEFSRKSRYHLLCRIAKIAWSRIPSSMFVTLTYPDEKAIVVSKHQTMQRSHFVRYAEKYLCEQIPMMWAKELQVRKSGVYAGHKLAHWHISIFTDKEIPVHKIKEWWARAIGWHGELQVHRKVLSSAQHAAYYLAKYTAKKSTEGILEYPPKLTNPGRAWGFLRDSLIPKCPISSYTRIAQEVFDVIQAAAASAWDDERGEIEEVYTFLGPVALRLAKEIYEILY